MNNGKRYYLLLCFLLTVNAALAQTKTDTAVQFRLIEIIQSDRLNMQKLDTTDLQSLAGNVIVKQERTTFYCDSAVINTKSQVLEAFGRVHINDADSIHTYSDYLKYIGKAKTAYLKKNVRLTDGSGTLTTNELEYNTLTKIGNYTKGGKVVSGKTTLTSNEAVYYGETKDVYFKKKVVLIDPETKINTDTLLYNTESGIARFVVPTKIITGGRTINTSDGFYDTKNKKAEFGKRPTIKDSTSTLIGDDIAFDDKSGLGHARGNVVYKDSAQGFAILANDLKTNKQNNSFLATQKPLMIIRQENDSIYITADTLYSGKLSDLEKFRNVPDVLRDTIKGKNIRDTIKLDSNTNRFFEAYYNVKIFQDSLQAVGDSLFYSFKDSVFRLFKSPVVWAQENQISGDTIYLHTKNKKPEKLYVIDNAMAINKASGDFFNQVKGKNMTGFFKEGNIDFLKTRGSPAESIYYGVDDNKNFVGVNKASSDIIDMYFVNRDPHKVVFRNKLQGITYPMRQVNHIDIRLRGFNWQESRRPKTKFELFGN